MPYLGSCARERTDRPHPRPGRPLQGPLGAPVEAMPEVRPADHAPILPGRRDAELTWGPAAVAQAPDQRAGRDTARAPDFSPFSIAAAVPASAYFDAARRRARLKTLRPASSHLRLLGLTDAALSSFVTRTAAPPSPTSTTACRFILRKGRGVMDRRSCFRGRRPRCTPAGRPLRHRGRALDPH
jgi:hypothetical protein